MVAHPLKLHLGTLEQLHCFILSIGKLISIPQQVIELTKDFKKRKKIERIETHAIKLNKCSRANMYHEMTPFIVFICNKKREHEVCLKSKPQIM